MPYGPGKFEAEPASTYLVYLAAQDGADEDAGNHAFIRGSILPGTENLAKAKAAGYTDEEIRESCDNLAKMAGAIMSESEQGFVHVDLYASELELTKDWSIILFEYDEAEGAAE